MWQIFSLLDQIQTTISDLKIHRQQLTKAIKNQTSGLEFLFTVLTNDRDQAQAFIDLASHLYDDPQLIKDATYHQVQANQDHFANSYYQIDLRSLQGLDNFVFLDLNNLKPILNVFRTHPQYQPYLSLITFKDLIIYQTKANHHDDKINLVWQWINYLATKYQINDQAIQLAPWIFANLENYCWLSSKQNQLSAIQMKMQPPVLKNHHLDHSVAPNQSDPVLISKTIVYDDQF